MLKQCLRIACIAGLAGCGSQPKNGAVTVDTGVDFGVSACADIFTGPMITIEGRGISTLASRADAFDALQARVGYVEPIFDTQGRISGLHAYNDNGLTRMQVGESMADTARRFVMENPALFDLQNAGIDTPDKLTWLKAGDESWGPLGNGSVTFTQDYRGVPIAGGIRVTFWDVRMAAWQGSLVNPCEEIVNPVPTISRQEAERLVRSELAPVCGESVDVQLKEAEVYLNAPALLLYAGTANSVVGSSPWCNYAGTVNAHSGKVSFRSLAMP